MPAFIELAIVRQVALRHHANDSATVYHHRRIEEPTFPAQRRSDDQYRVEVARGRDNLSHRRLRPIEQRSLQQQIVDSIGRQSQFRKQHHTDMARMPRRRQLQMRARREDRIGNPPARHAGGDAQEAMAVHAVDTSHPALAT